MRAGNWTGSAARVETEGGDPRQLAWERRTGGAKH